MQKAVNIHVVASTSAPNSRGQNYFVFFGGILGGNDWCKWYIPLNPLSKTDTPPQIYLMQREVEKE